MVRRRLLVLLALLLGGCLAPGPWTVVFDGTAGTRLGTTVSSGLFLTNVRIGGRDVGPFLIDSGSSALVFDVDLAETLRLPILEARHDAELKQTVSLATVRNLVVGPVTLRDAPVVVMDLSSVTLGFGKRLAGLLGYPLFASAVVEVDYVRQSVSCFDPARYRLPRGAWQPLTVKGQPGVPARVAGNVEGLFLVDTGSNGTVHLFQAFLQKHRLLEIRGVTRARNLKLGGEQEVFTGRIAWFELGGRRFESPWVVFPAPGGLEPRESGSFDGIIGQGFLREFVVVFNYPAGKIAFLPP